MTQKYIYQGLIFNLVIVFFLVIGDLVIAQSDTSFSQSEAKNALYIELVGNGGIISANYERFLTQDIGLRIGMGSGYLEELTVPVMVNYCIGKEYRFEIGIGLVHVPEETTLACATIGYRYQAISGGFVFRVGFTPILSESDEIIFLGGLSFGYAF
jgi:hypothetical protein